MENQKLLERVKSQEFLIAELQQRIIKLDAELELWQLRKPNRFPGIEKLFEELQWLSAFAYGAYSADDGSSPLVTIKERLAFLCACMDCHGYYGKPLNHLFRDGHDLQDETLKLEACCTAS